MMKSLGTKNQMGIPQKHFVHGSVCPLGSYSCSNVKVSESGSRIALKSHDSVLEDFAELSARKDAGLAGNQSLGLQLTDGMANKVADTRT